MKLVFDNITEEDLNKALKTYGSKLSVKKTYEEIKEEVFTRLQEVKPFPSLTNRNKISEQASYDYEIRSYQYESDTVLILDEIPKEDLLELLVELHGEEDSQEEDTFEEDDSNEDMEEDDWEQQDKEEEDMEEEQESEPDDDIFSDGDYQEDEEYYEDEDEEEYSEDEDEEEEELEEEEPEEEDVFADDEFESDDDEYESEDDDEYESEDEEENDIDEDSFFDGLGDEDEQEPEELEEEEDFGFDEELIEQEEVFENQNEGFQFNGEKEEESSNEEDNIHEQDIEIQTEGINDSVPENRIIENKVKEKEKEKLSFDLLQQGDEDSLDFISKIVGKVETEETIVEVNSHKEVEEEVDEKLKDLPANPIDYLKRYPRSTEEEVKKYYSAKEVDKYINRGLIQKIRGRLVI